MTRAAWIAVPSATTAIVTLFPAFRAVAREWTRANPVRDSEPESTSLPPSTRAGFFGPQHNHRRRTQQDDLIDELPDLPPGPPSSHTRAALAREHTRSPTPETYTNLADYEGEGSRLHAD